LGGEGVTRRERRKIREERENEDSKWGKPKKRVFNTSIERLGKAGKLEIRKAGREN